MKKLLLIVLLLALLFLSVEAITAKTAPVTYHVFMEKGDAAYILWSPGNCDVIENGNYGLIIECDRWVK